MQTQNVWHEDLFSSYIQLYSNRNRLKYRNFTFVGCILSRNVKKTI